MPFVVLASTGKKFIFSKISFFISRAFQVCRRRCFCIVFSIWTVTQIWRMVILSRNVCGSFLGKCAYTVKCVREQFPSALRRVEASQLFTFSKFRGSRFVSRCSRVEGPSSASHSLKYLSLREITRLSSHSELLIALTIFSGDVHNVFVKSKNL